MIQGSPLFRGRDNQDQLLHIMKILGTPDDRSLRKIAQEASLSPEVVMKQYPRYSKISWQNVVPKANAQAMDLLERLLQFDPMERLTAAEALTHPYFTGSVPGPSPALAYPQQHQQRQQQQQQQHPHPGVMPPPTYNPYHVNQHHQQQPHHVEPQQIYMGHHQMASVNFMQQPQPQPQPYIQHYPPIAQPAPGPGFVPYPPPYGHSQR